MKKVLFAISIIFLTTAFATYSYSAQTQKSIASEVIRFHVLANSDTQADQQLKLKVRDRILTDFSGSLSKSQNIAETRSIIYDCMSDMRQSALDEIKNNGYNYDVKVYMAKDYFPTKTYGDVSLPAGMYEALRVEIGDAQGKNWWCVVFPPLCYVDVTQKEVPAEEKMQLKNVLNEDEYDLVTQKTPEVKVKFKIVEVWNEIKNAL